MLQKSFIAFIVGKYLAGVFWMQTNKKMLPNPEGNIRRYFEWMLSLFFVAFIAYNLMWIKICLRSISA